MMKHPVAEMDRFFNEYKKAQQAELGKITTLKSKQMYSSGSMEVLTCVAMLDNLQELEEILTKMVSSLQVPKYKWLVFKNPEWFLQKSFEDALELLSKLKAQAPVLAVSNNVVQLTPKV